MNIFRRAWKRFVVAVGRCFWKFIEREMEKREFVPAPVWTTERPTVAGYYWVRTPNLSQRICRFYSRYGQQNVDCDYDLHCRFSRYGSHIEYAGPLPEPKS